MKKEQHTVLLINDIRISLRIIHERRRNRRVAIGKKAITLRLSTHPDEISTEKGIEWVQVWLEDLVQKKPDALQHLVVKTYENGHQLQVGSRQYLLEITYKDKKSHSAKLMSNVIQMSLSAAANKADLQKAVKHLASRTVAQDFLPEISQRVMDLNAQHFQKKVNSVQLKYNHTNWGSCSRSGNLNFSTRLLFAPQEVIDYLIIHELAHLIEANHSARFWALVAKAMPTYKDMEKWLKVNGRACDF